MKIQIFHRILFDHGCSHSLQRLHKLHAWLLKLHMIFFSYIEPITVYSLSLVHIPKSTQKPNQSKPSQEGKENKE